MRIALLCAPMTLQASTVEEHIQGIVRNSKHEVCLFRVFGGVIDKPLENYDAIILHYSLIAFPFRNTIHLNELSKILISNFSGPKIALVQDEYRCVNERISFFNAIGIHHVFSVVNSDILENMYPTSTRKFDIETVLTGYFIPILPNDFRKLPLLINRKIDVFYRSRTLPSWMGRTSTIKSNIPELVKNVLSETNFNYDVSSDEKERLYGDLWSERLQNSRITIASPSGFDFSDRLGHVSYDNNDYCNCDRCIFETPVQVISPRIFEYINSGTLIALIPGGYSGIIQPYKHYFPLEENLSNLPDLIRFSNTKEAQNFVEDAFTDLSNNTYLSYARLANRIDEVAEKLINENNPFLNDLVDMHPSRNVLGNFWSFYSQLIFNSLLKIHLPRTKRWLKNIYQIIFSLRNLKIYKLSLGNVGTLFRISILSVNSIFDLSTILSILSKSNFLDIKHDIAYDVNRYFLSVSSINFNAELISHLKSYEIYVEDHFILNLRDFDCLESSISLNALNKWLSKNFCIRAVRLHSLFMHYQQKERP